MTITEEFAKDIAEAIKATREQQRKAIKKQMEGYRLAKGELKQERDKAYDLLAAEKIDDPTYRRKLERLDRQEEDYDYQLENLSLTISDEALTSVERVFQLAISAESLWKNANPRERVEKLKQILSNPILEGLTVRYQLKKPFAWLAENKENKEWRRERDLNPR